MSAILDESVLPFVRVGFPGINSPLPMFINDSDIKKTLINSFGWILVKNPNVLKLFTEPSDEQIEQIVNSDNTYLGELEDCDGCDCDEDFDDID